MGTIVIPTIGEAVGQWHFRKAVDAGDEALALPKEGT
jgi:hypothetical protein